MRLEFSLLLLLLATAALTNAQRPLNTTNTSGVLMEPFFIKPTSTSTSKYHPEQRGGGNPYFNSNGESPGKGRGGEQRLLPPPQQHPNADIFISPLSGAIVGDHGSAQSQVPASNRLHKVNKPRQNKFNQLLQLTKNPNFTLNNPNRDKGQNYSAFGQRIEYQHGNIITSKKEARPEKFYSDPNDNVEPPKKSWSDGHAFHEVHKQLNNKNHMHTPSPPSYSEDDIDYDEKLGVKCTFEKPCAWAYDTYVEGTNFEVTTGANLTSANITGVMPGPSADNLKDANGHFLHLPLTPNTTTRILRSPVFSSTRERCYLEVFMHQSSMAYGSIKIVIEPVATRENSWVPAEIVGDDLRKWKYHHFEIDR
jgi:hypothetical protein